MGGDAVSERLLAWFCEQRPRRGWDNVAVEPGPRVPSFTRSLDGARSRYDLVFAFGPLSNQYPTRFAGECARALPDWLASLAADVAPPDEISRVWFGAARHERSCDEDGHVTYTVRVPVTVELYSSTALA